VIRIIYGIITHIAKHDIALKDEQADIDEVYRLQNRGQTLNISLKDVNHLLNMKFIIGFTIKYMQLRYSPRYLNVAAEFKCSVLLIALVN